MRLSRVSLGDFTYASFAVPQNPIGMGDFVSGRFSVPQNPILDAGMGEFVPAAFWLEPVPAGVGLGCGCGGSCFDCGGCGMGAIDYSFSGTGIASSIESMFGSTAPSQIPNWAVYLIGAGLAYVTFFQRPQSRFVRRR